MSERSTSSGDAARTKRAVLYLRANRRGLGSREAAARFVEMQRTAGRKVADLLGANVVGEYAEETALVDAGRRLDLLRMLGDLLIRPGIDYLITHDWARLVQNAGDIELVEQTAQKSGAQIVTVSGYLDEVPAEQLLDVLYARSTDRDGTPKQQRRAA
jgi:hypothetical protein